MHTLKPNKGVYLEYETGKDILTQGDKSSTRCDNLSLSKKCSQAKAYSYETKWGSEFCAYETAFSQHIFIKPMSSPILSLNNFVQVINFFFFEIYQAQGVFVCVCVCVNANLNQKNLFFQSDYNQVNGLN